jgi:hypothetical protein
MSGRGAGSPPGRPVKRGGRHCGLTDHTVKNRRVPERVSRAAAGRHYQAASPPAREFRWDPGLVFGEGSRHGLLVLTHLVTLSN